MSYTGFIQNKEFKHQLKINIGLTLDKKNDSYQNSVEEL